MSDIIKKHKFEEEDECVSNYSLTNFNPKSDEGSSGSENDSLLETARQKAAMIERSAYEEGFKQGEKAGMALGEQKLQPILKNINNLLIEIATYRDRMIQEFQGDIIKLSTAIAAKILLREIHQDDEAVLRSAQEAIKKMATDEPLTVIVSPSDFQFLSDNKELLSSVFGVKKEVSLMADPNLIKGGCIISSPSGEIDASIESQLKMLYQELLEENSTS